MKRFLPLLPLLLFLAAETVLKSFFLNSPHFEILRRALFGLAIVVAFVSLYHLVRIFRSDGRSVRLWDGFTAPTQETKWHATAILIVLLAGTFFRLWHLGTLADGMTYDEAYKGLDGIAIRELHERPVFLDWNGGREALVAYLVAANQKIFDGSIISVRLITPVTACLTLLFFYLFVKTIFNRNVALISTFLMAVSKYHIIHSRYGVRAGQFTVYEVATLYFVARGLESQRRFNWWFILAGAVAGVGFYTYIAYRIFPAILLAFLFQTGILQKLRKHTASIACGALVCLILMAPAVQYYAQHMDSFTERMKKTEAWTQKGKNEGESPVKLVLASTLKTLGMYTYEGDSIARHNVGIEPMLSPFASTFFLIGILLALLNFRKPYARFVLLYLFFGLLPGMLSVGAPNAPRNLASIPPAMVFVCFGLLGALSLLPENLAGGRRIFLSVVLGGIFLTGVNDALFRYPAILDSLPTRTAALWGMDRDQTNVARLLNQLGPGCAAHVSPQYYFHSTVEYLTYGKSEHELLTFNNDFGKTVPEGHVAILIFQLEKMNLWWLRDDDSKMFFKWWQQMHGLKITKIRPMIHETYDELLTFSTDRKLFSRYRRTYPWGKVVNLDHFTVFLFRPRNPTGAFAQPASSAALH